MSLQNKMFLMALLLSLAAGSLFGQANYNMVSRPETIDLGDRPNGCWTPTQSFYIWNTGDGTSVTSISCDNDYFIVEGPQPPFNMSSSQVRYFNVSTGTSSGLQTGNIAFTYGNGTKTLVVPLSAIAYDPSVPDVWEMPLVLNSYPYSATMNTANLHNNYTLPGNITDGKDAVFKTIFDSEVCLTARVSSSQKGKLAFYNEGFEGQPAPNNNNAIAVGTNILRKNDFENGIIDGTEWTNDPSHPWEISRINAQEGNFCIRTSKLTSYTNRSTLETSITVPTDCNLSFYWMVNYINWGCYGRFYIDDVEKGYYSSSYYQQSNYTITEGTHTLKWVMDYSQNSYQNAYLYVDNIQITNEESKISQLYVQPGTYYLVASATTENYQVDIQTSTPPSPVAASSPNPKVNSVCYGEIELSWKLGDFTSEYQLLYGETNPPTDVLVDWTSNLATSYTITPEEGKTYYWRVNERNSTGETLGEIWSFNHRGTITPDENNIIYVTPNGTGNGSSWNYACPDIQTAINCVAEMGDNKPVIWVAKGTYLTGSEQIVNGKLCGIYGHGDVKLYGSFNGDESANYDLSLRDFDNNATILDAESQCFVVVSQASEWDGFVMQYGGEGNFYSYSGTTMVKNCKILHSEGVGVLFGGGTLKCYHNQVSYHGQDGITMQNSYIQGPDIRDCVVSFNRGNGICANMCVRCQICNNGNGFTIKSNLGGYMIGCLVANNDGFGAKCKYIVNSTIVRNNTALARVRYNQSLVLCNNIIWGNRQLMEANYWLDFNNKIVANNVIQGGIEDKNGIYPCIKVNPKFVQLSGSYGSNYTGDWRLQDSSPCINMGMKNMEDIPEYASFIDYLDTDYAGNQRVQQGRIDIGAWESPYEKPNYLYTIRPDDNNIIYVKDNGQGQCNGSSWDNATSNLREAIETSVLYEPAATIWVAQGTYSVSTYSLQVKEQLKMYGGFVGTEPANYDLSQRDFVNHASVLNGNNALRVLYQMSALSAANSAVIDGFVLRNGTADNGAGAYLLGNTILSNCTLDHNVASSKGGGIYAENAKVENCILMNNTAQQGGGIYAKNAQVIQSHVGNNKATANGGGLYLNNSDLYQSHVVRNEGGCLAIDAADYNTHARLMNNIIWGNDTNTITYLTSAAQTNTTLSHCAVEGLTNHELGNIPLSANNEDIFGPNFVNPTEFVGLTETLGDWHLAQVSPCINAGSNTLSGTTLPDYDLDHNSRVFQNGIVDMGVYELMSETIPTVMEFIDASIIQGETYDFYGTILSTSGTFEHEYTENGSRHLVLLNLQVLNVTYVSENGAGTHDGSSWENALDGNTMLESGYTKFADALQNANGSSCFWVTSGTYFCSNLDASKHFVLTEGVRIYGGFAGTETTLDERDLATNITKFSGEIQNDGETSNNTDGIFVAPEAAPVWNESAYLDGITITQGYNATNTKGGALWVGEGTKVTINQCKVTQNWEGSIYNNGILDVRNSDLSNNRKEIEGPRDNRFMPDNSGYGARGAGVLFNLEHGIAYFDNCNFESNFSEKNGVFFNDGILRVNESLFDDNTATQFGTIFSWGKVILTNTVFNNNRAMNRIGLMMVLDSLQLVNCTLSDNHAHYYTNITPPPGNSAYGTYTGYRTSGIEAWGYSYVDNCQFLNNDGGTRLGGALSIMGTADLMNCTFIGNKGQYPWVNPNYTGGGLVVIGVDGSADGGALYVQGSATATDCVFSENTGAHGSTIGVDGSLTMERCKIVNSLNSIGIPYGAIKVTGTLIINNSLIANNRDGFLMHSNGAHTRIANSTIANMDVTLFMFEVNTNESTIDLDNCIVSGYSQWAAAHGDGVVINTNHTLLSQDISGTPGGDNDPLFVNPTTYLGYDENVDPLTYDWTLQAGSPCIDAGDVSLLTLDPLATDLAGEPRVKNGQIDMGAYEFGAYATQTVNLVQGWNWWSAQVVADDLLAQIEQGLGANGVKIVAKDGSYRTYSTNLGGWFGTLTGITVGQMYKIQTNTPCDISLTGTPVNPSECPIILKPGFTWIGYTPSVSLSVSEAMSGYTPTAGDVIKSKGGSYASYSGNLGRWVGDLTLEPGKGYIYESKATETKTFYYPSGN